MFRIPAFIGFLVLSGCSLSLLGTAETPIERLFAAQASYNSEVFQYMADYEGLPRCGGTQDVGLGPCSEQRVVDSLRLADTNWQIAYQGAKDAVAAGGEGFEKQLAITNTALVTALSLINSLRAQGVIKE